MIGRIRTSCTCWLRDKKLAIPAKGPSTKRVIRLCRRSRAAIRRRGRGLLDRFRRTNGDGQQQDRNAKDMAWSKVRAEGTCFLGFSVSSCPIAPSLQYSIIPLPPPLLHSPQDSLQPFPPFSSVWGGGRWPPRESGKAERTECEQRLESILRSLGCRASAWEPHPTGRGA